jgi:transposase
MQSRRADGEKHLQPKEALRESDWTKILGWPGYRVYQQEFNEKAETLRLWARRKAGTEKRSCSGCGRHVEEIHEVVQREVRDPLWGEYRVTVLVEVCRIRCPDCGPRIERVPQLPSKAPFSKRFEEAVRQAAKVLQRHNRWVHLTPDKQQILNQLFKLNRKVMKAYLLKESLEGLWKQKDALEGVEYLSRWVDQLKWQRLPAFSRLAKMLLEHHEGIFHYHEHPVRFGVVEAINGNIKLLLRRGRGYKNLRYLLFKAQRMAATKTELVSFRIAA